MNKLYALFISLFLVSCTSIIRTDEDAESIQLYFFEKAASSRFIPSLDVSCDFVGEVIGSEGHWYTFLFISNELLVQGAINDLKNNVSNKGGNAVVVYDNIDFTTSVTLLGKAYKCSPVESNDKARF